MIRPILLDTCVAIWIGADISLQGGANEALLEAGGSPDGILISPITAWEIGMLVSRGRAALSRPPQAWFEAMLQSGFVLAPMPPIVLVDSSFLPGAGPRDPADRILAATARAFDYRLMTRDKALLDYGRAGHLEAIAC